MTRQHRCYEARCADCRNEVELARLVRLIDRRLRGFRLAEHHAAKVVEEKVYVAPVVAEVTSLLQNLGFLHGGTKAVALTR